MVFCSKCGQENPDDAKYCSKCGALIKDYSKDEVKPVEEKVEVRNDNNKNSNNMSKSKMILIGIGVFIIAFILFVVISIANEKPTSLMGEYKINFNNNYNDKVRVEFGNDNYLVDLSQKKSTTTMYAGYWYNEGDVSNLKLKVCNIRPEFTSNFENKCDIINYKITSQNENFYIEETYCSECKRELNVVSSLNWIGKND